MARRAELCAVLSLVVLACAAHAGQVLDYYGFSWESSSTVPVIPWQAGNTLHVVGLVDTIEPPLLGDLSTREFTLSVSAVQDGPSAPLGTGVDSRGAYNAYQITYGPPVEIAVYEDTSRNSAFDPNPPNSRVPATFDDGTPYLTATASEFVIFLNAYLSGDESASLEMDLTITGGSHAGDLGGVGAVVHTTHSLRSPHASIPAGFTHRVDGEYVLTTSPVTRSTWGGIKALYR